MLVARQRPEGDTPCTRDLLYAKEKVCMIRAGEHIVTWLVRPKLKMRTVHANTDHNHNLAHELVPEIGSCTARARPTSQLGLLISKSSTHTVTTYKGVT